jgi:hypothetical protein
MALALLYVVPTLANPNNYPQFAQQQVDPAIPIFFTGVERVKAQLDTGQPPMLVMCDWRYDAACSAKPCR